MEELKHIQGELKKEINQRNQVMKTKLFWNLR
jgi:hypothetical protein